jgi:uncharacterized protein (DUF2384 family)
MAEKNPDRAGHVTDSFNLPIGDLRAADGAFDPAKIAEALGVPLSDLLRAAGIVMPAHGRTAGGEELESQLLPYVNVIGMLRDAYQGNQAHVRAWLETPQEDLGGSTPLAVLMTPGKAVAVEQLLSGAWLGIPD